MTHKELDQSCINTIHTLSMDAVQTANSAIRARYVGTTGYCIAMRSFGASAPLRDPQKHFGFTVDQIVEAAGQQLRQAR